MYSKHIYCCIPYIWSKTLIWDMHIIGQYFNDLYNKVTTKLPHPLGPCKLRTYNLNFPVCLFGILRYIMQHSESTS